MGQLGDREGRAGWHLDRPTFPNNLTPAPGLGKRLATYCCPWCSQLSLQLGVFPHLAGEPTAVVEQTLTNAVEQHIRTMHPGMPVRVSIYPPAIGFQAAGRDM